MTFEEWLSRTIPLDPAQQFVAKCAWEAAAKQKQLEHEPVAWINARGDYCEVSRPDTVYGSHTIPLYLKEDV